MTSWFRLTLCFVALLYLLLHLTQPADLNHQLQIVGWGSWFDRGREPAPDVLTVSAVRSMEFRARAGPRQSLVLNSTLTAGNSGPPGWESHGPSAPIGPWRVAGQAVTGDSNQRPSSTLQRENTGSNHQFLKLRGFATPFS